MDSSEIKEGIVSAITNLSSMGELPIRRPFHEVFVPKLYGDGDQWCALYGVDLQEGIAGFGSSPRAAIDDFNREFVRSIKPKN